MRTLILFLVCGLVPLACGAHERESAGASVEAEVASFAVAQAPPDGGARTSGQGDLVFRVFKTNRDLPRGAIVSLLDAHGGFGVDRRPERGEIYFALPKAGIFRISSDLGTIEPVPTGPQLRELVLHNTAVWHAGDRTLLTFPSVSGFAVYTSDLEGTVLNALGAPNGADYSIPAVRDFFDGKNVLVPTDVAFAGDRMYVTTGYSPLDYVLSAKVEATADSVNLSWTNSAFGGKGSGAGQLDVGHGVTLEPGGEALSIADRKNGEVDRFDLAGNHLGTLKLPEGSLPCDTDFQDGIMVVSCLGGPDPRGAPIYLVRDGEIVSTINPKVDLGLPRFQHIHNAVMVKREGRFYIIAQAWMPGDFAILEQVVAP